MTTNERFNEIISELKRIKFFCKVILFTSAAILGYVMSQIF